MILISKCPSFMHVLPASVSLPLTS